MVGLFRLNAHANDLLARNAAAAAEAILSPPPVPTNMFLNPYAFVPAIPRHRWTSRMRRASRRQRGLNPL